MKVIFTGVGYGPIKDSKVNFLGKDFVLGQPTEVDAELGKRLLIRTFFVAEKDVNEAAAEAAREVKAEEKAEAVAAKAAEKEAVAQEKAEAKAEKAHKGSR